MRNLESLSNRFYVIESRVFPREIWVKWWFLIKWIEELPILDYHLHLDVFLMVWLEKTLLIYFLSYSQHLLLKIFRTPFKSTILTNQPFCNLENFHRCKMTSINQTSLLTARASKWKWFWFHHISYSIKLVIMSAKKSYWKISLCV